MKSEGHTKGADSIYCNNAGGNQGTDCDTIQEPGTGREVLRCIRRTPLVEITCGAIDGRSLIVEVT